MKRKIQICLAAAAVIVVPSLSQAGISGTDHDLSTKQWGTDQQCVFCHTPHNAKASGSVPLWNHTTTTATFTPYASSTLNATVGQPAGISKACLSCHDGSIAIDAFGGNTGSHLLTGSANFGTDLSNDHPISFTYNAALATADSGLVTPQADGKWVDAGHTIPLYNGQLECASCHNPHSDTYKPFLRKSNAGSALCLSCHSK
ncbi:MAG TPA: cytochrome c3 family protein [Candidatus Paceibacterota bacterium]|nr:cytochrome c3 family protein [Candidatus Paceibacterota bacterium]